MPNMSILSLQADKTSGVGTDINASNGFTLFIQRVRSDRVYGFASIYGEKLLAYLHYNSGVVPTWHYVPCIMEKDVSVSADSSGNASLNLSASSHRIVSVCTKDKTFNGPLLYYSYNNNYYVHLMNWNGTAASSGTTATVRVTYMAAPLVATD